MVLSKETTVILTNEEANILGHMNYAAYKLWNVCNYERNNYRNLGLSEYPDWYYQKKPTRITSGIGVFRPRLLRKFARLWINPGNPISSF